MMQCPNCGGERFAVDFGEKKATCAECSNVVWLTSAQQQGAQLLEQPLDTPDERLYGVQPTEAPAYGQEPPKHCHICGSDCLSCAAIKRQKRDIMTETRPGAFRCQHCGAENVEGRTR